GSGGNIPGGDDGYALGGVFNRGAPTPFANGGLDSLPDLGSQPAVFRMANGATGSIRERHKTEAIMPVIGRGPSGRLGVELIGRAPSSATSSVTTIDNRKTITIPISL